MLSILTLCLLMTGAPPGALIAPSAAPLTTPSATTLDAGAAPGPAQFGAGPALERAATLPGGDSAAGDFRVVLTATTVSGEATAGDFRIAPGLDPAGDSTTPIFSDGFESGDLSAWSAVFGAAL